MKVAERVRDRIRRRPIPARSLAAAGRPDPVALLGQVDEPEIEAEGPDDDLGSPGVEPRQLGREGVAVRRVVVAAEPDGGAADALDELEQVATGLFGDDLAEERAEQPDLEGERVTGSPGPHGQRLGEHGDVGTLARRRPPTRRRLPAVAARLPHAAHRARSRRAPFRTAGSTVPQPFRGPTFRRLVS